MQLPQFLFEAGYGNRGVIAITQPRRVAATSTAFRVAHEMGDTELEPESSSSQARKPDRKHKQPTTQAMQGGEAALNTASSAEATSRLKPLKSSTHGKRKPLRATAPKVPLTSDNAATATNIPPAAYDGASTTGVVGYQVRFDSSTVKDTTRILFMTDGILLREVSSDLLLRKYSVVILDEAHERNVNTDILLGMLSRAVPLRRELSDKETAIWNSLSEEEKSEYEEPIAPLKLVIMSATLRIDDFKNPVLFPSLSPPVINVEARQYPVVTHFARKTEVDNYLKETFRKVCQIHRKLPAGGVLVFLTGKREILHMCRKLAAALSHSSSGSSTGTFLTAKRSDNNSSNRSRMIAGDAGDLTAEAADLEEDDIEAEMESNLLGGADQFDLANNASEAIGASWNPDSDGEDSDAEIDGANDLSDLYKAQDAVVEQAGAAATEKNAEEEVDAVPRKKVAVEAPADGAVSATNVENPASLRSKMLAEALGLKPTHSDAESSSANSGEDKTKSQEAVAAESGYLKPIILPLYAMMSPAQQARVFREMPPGTRLIVVATNVAETSITIPGIRYVVDCGRQKVKTLQSSTGIWYVDIYVFCNWLSRFL
jgi:ATP-dependent RNA helicase DHX37/DHR1